MEYRKLIKFGNSSHVVSIPNEWIKRNNLKKGDTLYLSENGSNELILSPKVDTTNLNGGVKEIIIDISNCTTNDIKTKLTSAYLNDHTEIKITGSN
ncbi:MAG: AbrB/MazE/SpoVT family DNA-binding domain-containing protein, partial [Nanoarchaeota archaeon]